MIINTVHNYTYTKYLERINTEYSFTTEYLNYWRPTPFINKPNLTVR
jgi:hypothetical protein